MFFVRHYFLCKNIKRENIKEIFLSYPKALRYWSVLAGLELVTSRLAVRHYQFTGYRVYLAAVNFLVKKKSIIKHISFKKHLPNENVSPFIICS